MKKIVKPHKARKPSASTDVPSFARGKDQILKSPTRLQKRNKNESDEFDDGKNTQSLIYYDSSTGKFTNANDEEVTPLNRIGDDPSRWTYVDSKNRKYFPTQSQANSGEITQGENPSTMDRFLNLSEQHYNDPILGAPARYADMVRNGQDPITGVASFVPGVGEAIDLGSAAADALSGNYGSAIVGGMASILPFVPYNKARKLYNRLLKPFGHNTTQDVSNNTQNVSDVIGGITNQTKYTPSDEDIYQTYLESDDFKYDARTYNNLADRGFFGPDYYGYINDYNDIHDENKQVYNAIESAMNNPNITEDQAYDLIDQYSVASYPFYPPYPFSESPEILNSFERAQNAKRNLNNNYSIRDLFQLQENIHDNSTIQYMRDLVQNYRNAEQSGELLQSMIIPGLFVHNTNNPEFISLRDELYRYQDLARNQERERLRQQLEQISNPINFTQVGENSLTDKQIANSLIRNEPYDPNNLPEEFINATSDVSDRTSAAYFYDDPKRALREARNDFESLQHGQAWNLNHHGAVSTDSYPLMLSMFRRHQKDGLIKPIKDKDGNIKFMRLNSFGKHKGEAAVKRINKRINDLSETIGEQLPEAKLENENIYVPEVLFRKYDEGKDSGIHIKKVNRGKFTAAAKRAGMGVQAYARKILSAPKGKYSPTLRRRAAFAKAASKFKH